MDELDKYIKDNKEKLNDFEPSESLWDKIDITLDDIDKELDRSLDEVDKALGQIVDGNPNGITISFKRIWQFAAVFLIFALLWGARHYLKSERADEQVAEVPVEVPKLNEVNPELAEAEVYYVNKIQKKREELAKIAPQELEAFDKEMEQLDSLYKGLKKEFFNTPNQEEVANAMIENLRIRVKILNRQIEILERYQPTQNENENETKYL